MKIIFKIYFCLTTLLFSMGFGIGIAWFCDVVLKVSFLTGLIILLIIIVPVALGINRYWRINEIVN